MVRIAIDPITRIGGHLRVEVEVSGGVVTDAWSSGTVFRGMELILKGRDPRDAWLFAQRVCGACTTVHALASVRAVENALGVTIPRNARLIRNLLAGSQYVLDHVVSFYHQNALDWVDVVAALGADPADTARLAQSISDWPNSSESYFAGVRAKLRAVVDSGQLGPFANGYWGHPAYKLPPAADLMAVAHYLEALDWHRDVSRIHTLLGGKNPHPQTFLVGGMALSPEWGGPKAAGPKEHPQQVERNSPNALGPRGLSDISELIARAKRFVDQVYLPDVLTIGAHDEDWAGIGKGIGNYLSYGEFPEDDAIQPALLLPKGRIMDRALTTVQPVDQASVGETVAHAYYTYDGGDQTLKHPFDGQTQPKYAGPPPPVATLEGSEKYSWLKAPRYQEQPMEVGPLARVLVAYVQGQGDVKAALDNVIDKLGAGPAALFSTFGRTIARAVEAQVVATRLDGWLRELTNNLATGDLAVVDLAAWDPGTWPREAQGRALVEASRGAVGHWVRIRDQAVDHYQIVDASTWNGSPRDASGRRGALEEALVGTPVADPRKPVEILRTVHSFDLCTACAAHMYDAEAGGPVEIRVRPGGGGR